MAGPSALFSMIWMLLVCAYYQCHGKGDNCQNCEDECLQVMMEIKMSDGIELYQPEAIKFIGIRSKEMVCHQPFNRLY
jgi:hypothetical protein